MFILLIPTLAQTAVHVLTLALTELSNQRKQSNIDIIKDSRPEPKLAVGFFLYTNSQPVTNNSLPLFFLLFFLLYSSLFFFLPSSFSYFLLLSPTFFYFLLLSSYFFIPHISSSYRHFTSSNPTAKHPSINHTTNNTST